MLYTCTLGETLWDQLPSKYFKDVFFCDSSFENDIIMLDRMKEAIFKSNHYVASCYRSETCRNRNIFTGSKDDGLSSSILDLAIGLSVR